MLGVPGDNSTAQMYSNLRQQGGSNHYLLPTSVLQLWGYAGHGATDGPFGGGLVRVEKSTSLHMAGYCPAETSARLAPGAVELLRRHGHSGRAFNPAFALNIGPHALPPRAKGAPFVRYSLPAYELRRQLRDARAKGERFELVYTHLPGAAGDERWRATVGGRTIRLVEGARTSCTVLAPGEGGARTCQADDVALAPFPRRDYWARPVASALGALQSWNPHPILEDVEPQTELHCYG